MFNNLLETKEGKRFITICGIALAVLVGAILFSLLSNHGNSENKSSTSQSTGNISINDSKNLEAETKNAVVYQGTWYSNRSDNMIVELKSDGTYTASSWLTKGKYYLKNNKMILTDSKFGTKDFELDNQAGQTVMHLKDKNEDVYLYPNKDLLDRSKGQQEKIDDSLTSLKNQKWSDILLQNKWEKKLDGVTFSIMFYKNKYEQIKVGKNGDKETHIFSYRIVTQSVDDDKSTYQISRTAEDGNVDEISFTLSEGKTSYELSSSPGTFLWTPVYEKLKSDVELTQDGTTKEEAPVETTQTTDAQGNKVTITERIKS
ncbi:hypothetical protein [Lactococcus lactis]|uniref:hypothetical protein n=1 Tax=Lactococcus lactis TaxID=1358 RepID=UPI001D18F32B|nr:hypothetical protein [Lactococcus lactis]MCC4121954.1 hypothetical protein [Lactococcus lactis]